MKYKCIIYIAALSFFFTACTKEKNTFDASGTFESTEVIVSSQAQGQIMQFDIQEGQNLAAGTQVGYIDSTQLYWKKQQLIASGQAIAVTEPDVSQQVAAIRQQIANAETEKRRTQNLVSAGAVPQKQLDDINEQIRVLQKQLDAQQSTVTKNAKGIQGQVKPVSAQIQEVNDQLKNCKIVNPITGTVLVKYAEQNEITAPGKPLYSIADLKTMTLRAYITGSQLSEVKLGQNVKVYIDKGANDYRELSGQVTWISDQAEFTPKTIQTKDERADLVYAVKISVQNDGYVKIGMYGEIKLQ
ncbi:MAG TPA: efflux RND transporter periplasmic adaptor subunit [Flavipsychrobacter sp.]|nr:efflux RND transporter periplasmic adaptor subunit [Flavipsychrobacter sp.]